MSYFDDFDAAVEHWRTVGGMIIRLYGAGSKWLVCDEEEATIAGHQPKHGDWKQVCYHALLMGGMTTAEIEHELSDFASL